MHYTVRYFVYLVAMMYMAVNGLCFLLLWRHRGDDLNMSSVWLCSRNDLVANAAVLLAAALVGGSGSRWPDILVGLGIAALFLHSAYRVIRDARAELKRPTLPVWDIRIDLGSNQRAAQADEQGPS
jgi:Co/Zn/Cd efflux system component